jgi:HEAT repeat protein
VATAFRKARAEGDDPRVIQHLSVLLGRSRSEAALEALVEALADGSPDVRIFAAAALVEHGDPAGAKALLPRLDDLDPAVRALAAYAAADLASREGAGDAATLVRPALVKALGDPSVDVRWNAALGLARFGSAEGADLVWSMLHRDYVRANLRRGDGRGGGLLAPQGADPQSPEECEERVVLSALSAVYRLKDRSMLSGVRLLGSTDPSDAVRSWAMRAEELLEQEVREKGPEPSRMWTAGK